MANPPWHIEYYKDARGRRPVVDWLKSLDPKHRARVVRTIDLLAEYGVTLGSLHSKFVRGKIWELRTSVARSEYRILYFAAAGHTFVMLQGFAKKTQKTPERVIALAESREAEWEAPGWAQ